MGANDRSRRGTLMHGWLAGRVHVALALVIIVSGMASLTAPATTQAISAQATGRLSFEFSEVNFGDQPVGIPTYRLVQLRVNGPVTGVHGTVATIIDGRPVADLDFFDVDQDNRLRTRCLDGVSFINDYCTVAVLFRPSALGARVGRIAVEYDDAEGHHTLTLALTGTGVGPVSGPHSIVRQFGWGNGVARVAGGSAERIVPPQGGWPSADSPTYPPGTDLTITAEPGEGYYLEHWSIQGVDYGAQNPIHLRTNGEAVITAVTAFNVGNPVPTITGLNPSHIQASGGPLTVTVGGTNFIPGAVARWNGAPRPTTFVSGRELRVELTATDLGGETAADITVFNPGPVGGTSYPAVFFVTRGNTAVTASASGTSTDPNGGATASMGGSGPGTPGSLSVRARGAGTVTVAQFGGNPAGAPNFGVPGGSAFLDARVTPGHQFTAAIVNCNLGGATTLYWWNGSSWSPASDQSATPAGCVTVTVSAVTSPSLDQLTGTYIAAGMSAGPPPRYADVPTTSPAHAAIEQLSQRGVIRGYADGTFGPDDPSVRAQMAALIARAMGWDAEDRGNPFPDRGAVDDDLWRNVGLLAARGVARGYADGTYNPTGDVLNQQMVLFISRAMVERGVWQPQADTNPYPNLPGATAQEQADRRDIATYVHYAGAVPDRPVGQAWGDWEQAATRAWFARALWQALQSGPVAP
ncbi:MAG TPA: S-layer homology domain-containing protein [Thermomicrobiales bacterium]